MTESTELIAGDQPLTSRGGQDEQFCLIYCRTLDHIKAARLAYGASEDSAKHNAMRILQRPHIAARVGFLQAEALREANINPAVLINELRYQAFSDHLEIFTPDTLAELGLDNMNDDTRRAIESLDFDALYERDGEGNRVQIGNRVKVKFYSKQKAIEMLARIFSMFKDKIEHTGADGKPLGEELNEGADVVASKIASLLARAQRRAIEDKHEAVDADVLDNDVSDLL